MKNINPFAISQEQPDILLVEDNDDDAEMVTFIFEKNHVGNSIVRLKDGREVIDYFLNIHSGYSLNSVPKIILLDYKLPGMDGISLLRRLRANEQTRNIPVILFTGFEGDTTAFESYSLGIASIITKNASYEALEKSLLEVQLYLDHFKILIVEDNPIDAQMIEVVLHASNIQFTAQVASNEHEYLASLHSFKPDVIFCDYDLKKYDAIRAIRTLKALEMNIPFIMVTGVLNEDYACGCMSEGIKDYLLKSNLTRLPSSLVNALRKKKIEDEIERAHKELNNNYLILSKSSERMKQAQEIAHIGSWSLDFTSNVGTWSEETCRIYGLPVQDNKHSFEKWITFLHPDDKERVLAEFNNSQKTLSDLHFYHRIILGDGTEKYIYSVSKFELDGQGNPTGIYGISHDITEQKRREDEIRNDQVLVENLLFDISHKVRQPVATILGISKLFDNSVILSPEEIKFILCKMKESISLLDTSTRDLTILVSERKKKKRDN